MAKFRRRLMLAAFAFALALAALAPSRAWAATGVAVGGEWYDAAFTLDGLSWDGEGTITLTDYHGTYLTVDGSVTLVLEGENTLDFEVTSEEISSAITFRSGEEGGSARYTITGDGSLAITAHADSASGLVVGGISVSDGELAVVGAKLSIEATSGGSGSVAMCLDGGYGSTITIAEGSAVDLTATADSVEPDGAFANCISVYGGTINVADSTLSAKGRVTGTITIPVDGHPEWIAFSGGLSATDGSSINLTSSRLNVSPIWGGVITITNCDLNVSGVDHVVASEFDTIAVADCEGAPVTHLGFDGMTEILGTEADNSEIVLQHTGPASAYAAGVQDDSAPEESQAEQAMSGNDEQLPIVIGITSGLVGTLVIAGIIVKTRRKKRS